MPISRFLLFSPKNNSIRSLNLIHRWGPSKKIQSCNYVKSSRKSNGKPDDSRLMNVDIQTTPRSRSRSWSYVIPVALLGFVGLAAVVQYNDERRAIPKGHGNRSTSPAINGPIIGGPFTLTNTENQTITEKDLLGKWVLLYFGYTFSPDVGPEQLQIMAKTVDTLGSKHNVNVLPVFVTIDPQRDTPSHLRAYLKEFDPRIVGLTGRVSAIRQMAQEFRVYFRKVEEEGDDYLVESSHNMYLMNPKMEVVRCFGVEFNADELTHEILKELNN